MYFLLAYLFFISLFQEIEYFFIFSRASGRQDGGNQGQEESVIRTKTRSSNRNNDKNKKQEQSKDQ